MLPGLIRRIVEAHDEGAPEVVVWGSGTPCANSMHVTDCAAAIVWLAEHLDRERLTQSDIGQAGLSHINCGSGQEVPIGEAAALIAELVGYRGQLRFDRDKPDGTPRKRLDCSLLSELGFQPQISLREGLQETLAWFRAQSRTAPCEPARRRNRASQCRAFCGYCARYEGSSRCLGSCAAVEDGRPGRRSWCAAACLCQTGEASACVVSARYGSLNPGEFGMAQRLRKLAVPLAGETYEVTLYEGRLPGPGANVPLYLIDHPLFSERPGIYGPPDQPGHDYGDNWRRFASCRAPR